MEQLLEKAKMALAREYHARDYSGLEIELVTVIYEIDGPHLHKSHV